MACAVSDIDMTMLNGAVAWPTIRAMAQKFCVRVLLFDKGNGCGIFPCVVPRRFLSHGISLKKWRARYDAIPERGFARSAEAVNMYVSALERTERMNLGEAK